MLNKTSFLFTLQTITSPGWALHFHVAPLRHLRGCYTCIHHIHMNIHKNWYWWFQGAKRHFAAVPSTAVYCLASVWVLMMWSVTLGLCAELAAVKRQHQKITLFDWLTVFCVVPMLVCVCSGTAPLACLVTMLHSQVRGDRVKNSIFFKLPGRMSLFTLKVFKHDPLHPQHTSSLCCWKSFHVDRYIENNILKC